MHDAFEILYHNWPVGQPLALGDYGSMTGDIFIRKGHLSDRKIVLSAQLEDHSGDDYEYKTDNAVEVASTAKVDAAPGGMPIHAAGYGQSREAKLHRRGCG